MNYKQRFSRIILFRVMVFVLVLVLPSHLQAQAVEKFTTLVWSPDGSQIAGASDRGHIYIWDAIAGQVRLEFQAHEGAIYSISWSPDGSRLASISPHDGLVRIWDTTSANLIAELIGDRNPLDSALVAWNPNGTMIVSVTANTDGGFPLHFWGVQADTYQPLSLAVYVSAFDIGWSPNGEKLAVADYRDVYLFDDFSLPSLEPQPVVPFRYAIAWSPDGSKLAAANLDGTVQILNWETGEILTSVGDVVSDTQHRAASIIWDNDNIRLFTDRFDGTTQVWNTSTGELVETLSLERQGGRGLMTLSPYGGRLALGNSASLNDGTSIQAERGIIQTFAGGAIQIVVPVPSRERLQAIAEACNAPTAVEQALTADIQADQLAEFVAQVEALPENTIPSACAADLIAVAEALQNR
jgi:WD40 repeat protein